MLTKLINEGKRGQDITEEDLRHPDKKCHRNTKYSPANAEENAMEDLGRNLLIDPATGKFLPDEEAILCLQVITDGDTKGAIRLMKAQADLVTEFDGKGSQYPDVGHFMKCISGALHRLAGEGFGGANLLEPARIKTIVADISKSIKSYGETFKKLYVPTQTRDQQHPKLAIHRAATLKHIMNIVPHHCGDHHNCLGDCNMIKLQRYAVARHCAETGDKVTNAAEILPQYSKEVLVKYANESRFQGKSMSMSPAGVAAVNHEISKRLNDSNIDRVALTYSSNNCENFFGMLTKYSHGKRINFG